MLPWSDTHRYNQTGYSSPTIFPQPENYVDKTLWAIDHTEALMRENSRQDWIDEEYAEARLEYLEQQAEIKAEREEMEGW